MVPILETPAEQAGLPSMNAVCHHMRPMSLAAQAYACMTSTASLEYNMLSTVVMGRCL